jgi:hypothetical protein
VAICAILSLQAVPFVVELAFLGAVVRGNEAGGFSGRIAVRLVNAGRAFVVAIVGVVGVVLLQLALLLALAHSCLNKYKL